jgi:hypothetical protein
MSEYKYEIKNIRRGRKEDNRDQFIYAELWKVPTLTNVGGVPELLIAATLDHITIQFLGGKII